MSTVAVSGVVRGLGEYYVSGLEVMEIHVNRKTAGALGPVLDQRCGCFLEIGHDTYQAGLRATQRNAYVWICPDLTDSRGERVKLADVLRDHGFVKNQRVTLKASGSTYRLI